MAYFKVDHQSGRLLESGGDLNVFALDGCIIDHPLEEGFPLLNGLLPLEDEYLCIPHVESASNHYMDVHLFRELSDFDWIICQDRSAELRWQQIAQQKSNELELLKSERATNYFELFNVLPFEFKDNNRLIQLETTSNLFETLFSNTFSFAKPINLAERFSFLDSFLYDAKEIWDNNLTQHRKKSGPWLEQADNGVEVPMEATALYSHGKKLLILEILDEQYQEKLQLLQLGREEALLRQRADFANQEKSKFLANMSHELRTPLNVIIGFTDLCLSMPDKHQEYLEKIRISSKTLLGLIDNILDFSKLEAGKLDLECYDFDLRRELLELQSMFSYLAREKDIELNMTLDEQVPQWVHGDALRLKQVLMNLITNAIKFTHLGQIDVFVNQINRINKTQWLEFVIKDSGIGISEEKQHKIFEAFIQAEETTTRKYGGTGLGLAICKQLVEQMQGKFNLTSEVGKGSVFSFQIPLAAVMPFLNLEQESSIEQDSSSMSEFISNEQSKTLTDLAGKCILLVEDNELNQNLLQELLKPYDMILEVVDNGLSAVAKVIVGGYDCVLMDINMPIMDGYQATKIIREKVEFKTLPILALTANTSTEEQLACKQAGMNDYIAKPISVDILLQKLMHWTNKKQ